MNLLSALGIVGAVALLAQAGAVGQETGNTGNQVPESLLGTYRLVGGQRAGEEIPMERLQEVTVRIGANAITTYDKEQNTVYAATYRIESSEAPYKILMTSKIPPTATEDTQAEGLLAEEGDLVKLIYALPGGATPTEFVAGPAQQLFVLEKTGP